MPETDRAGAVTIGGALQDAARRLATVSDTPALDANLLLEFTLGRPRSYLFAHPEDRLDQTVATQFRNLLERRAQGEPVAYLLGEQGFWSLALAVSSAVLVPRPETELLVETALSCLPSDQSARIADLGTGSGAIALALAMERPDCRVIATDRDGDALAIARANGRRLDLPRVEFRQGNWFEPLGAEQFELIVANPPYVAPDDPHLADLVYEPRTALVAADKGVDCLRTLVEHAAANLVAGGWLLLEHGMDQDTFVRDWMARIGFGAIGTKQDLAGHPRVTMGQLPRL